MDCRFTETRFIVICFVFNLFANFCQYLKFTALDKQCRVINDDEMAGLGVWSVVSYFKDDSSIPEQELRKTRKTSTAVFDILPKFGSGVPRMRIFTRWFLFY